MPRTCSICSHERRSEIDQALIGGEAYRSIAKQYDASEAAMFRHKRGHLTEAMVRSKAAKEEVQSDKLFDKLKQLHQATLTILKNAEEGGDPRLALQAVGRAGKLLELEARLLGELDESTKVAVGVQIEHQPEPVWDLSDMTMEELEEMERLSLKATRRASGDSLEGPR